jgi:hypothetical protein
VVRRTSIARPRSWSASVRSTAGKASTSVVMTWLAVIACVRANQKADSCVSTRPLSGMPEPST